jgi:hypothetical protein
VRVDCLRVSDTALAVGELRYHRSLTDAFFRTDVRIKPNHSDFDPDDSEKQGRAAMDSRNVVYFLDFGPFPYARALVEGGLVLFGRDLSGRILATVSGERYRHGNWIAAGLERYDRINRGPDCICLHHGVSSRYHKITSTSTFRIRRTASRPLPSPGRDPQCPPPSPLSLVTEAARPWVRGRV